MYNSFLSILLDIEEGYLTWEITYINVYRSKYMVAKVSIVYAPCKYYYQGCLK